VTGFLLSFFNVERLMKEFSDALSDRDKTFMVSMAQEALLEGCTTGCGAVAVTGSNPIVTYTMS
jgi:hypothetical protein